MKLFRRTKRLSAGFLFYVVLSSLTFSFTYILITLFGCFVISFFVRDRLLLVNAAVLRTILEHRGDEYCYFAQVIVRFVQALFFSSSSQCANMV